MKEGHKHHLVGGLGGVSVGVGVGVGHEHHLVGGVSWGCGASESRWKLHQPPKPAGAQ